MFLVKIWDIFLRTLIGVDFQRDTFCLFRLLFPFVFTNLAVLYIKYVLMKKLLLMLCAIACLCGCNASADAGKNKIDNTTVTALDVPRFMGVWYEIARYEHRFEKGMTHVTATYTLQDDGKISVLNQGMKDGKAKSAEGRARQPDASDPGKLEVSFFLWFYSDYYILELADDYSYAVIGSSTDKYLWILSRTSTLPDSVTDRLLENLQGRGYDTSRLVFVEQG